MQKEIDGQHEQIALLESKCDALTLARSDLTKELAALKVDFNCQVRDLIRQVDDSVRVKENMQLQLAQLREEIERLRTENAEEWGKRERLESHKHNLERQCKKLTHLNDDYKSRLDKLTAHNNTGPNSTEWINLQSELEQKQNEGRELKHVNGKLKKLLHENREELQHCQRKSEQSEKEVRGLRSRIEQLKQELGETQDEVDISNTTIRRLERGNEELVSQIDGMQVQIEHLTSR